jgi:uncharacterized protein (TIGR02594 family)
MMQELPRKFLEFASSTMMLRHQVFDASPGRVDLHGGVRKEFGMRDRIQHLRAFRLAALAATVMTTLCAATSADARRGRLPEHSERYERSTSHIWTHRGGSWTEERSVRPRAYSKVRRHVRRSHKARAKMRQVGVRPSRNAMAAVSLAERGPEFDRAAPPSRRESRRMHRRAAAWAYAPTAADRPAYAYEPAAETPSSRVFRGHETASRPRQRRLASVPPFGSGGGGGLVAEARRWIGTNPTSRRSLWCGAFMNFVLERSGHEGTGSDLAKSFASIGRRVSGPQVGAIAVMSRRGGGHVGVVSGIDSAGNPIIISGNSRGRRVAEGTYPRGRVYAYVMP